MNILHYYDEHPMKPTVDIPGLIWMSNDMKRRTENEIRQSYAQHYDIPVGDIYVVYVLPANVTVASIYVDRQHEAKVMELWAYAQYLQRLMQNLLGDSPEGREV